MLPFYVNNFIRSTSTTSLSSIELTSCQEQQLLPRLQPQPQPQHHRSIAIHSSRPTYRIVTVPASSANGSEIPTLSHLGNCDTQTLTSHSVHYLGAMPFIHSMDPVMLANPQLNENGLDRVSIYFNSTF